MSEKNTEKGRRKPGGSGFADAIFRSIATSDEYAKTMFDRAVKKSGSGEFFEIFMQEKFFIISAGEKPIAIKDFDFVESKRCESADAFEDWVKEIIDGNL